MSAREGKTAREEVLEMTKRSVENTEDSKAILEILFHLENPCHVPGKPELHCGDVYLEIAQKLLEKMQAKPVEERNEYFIKLLKNGIENYKKQENKK